MSDWPLQCRPWGVIAMVACLGLLGLPRHAAAASLKFLRTTDLPEAGLRVRLMPDAREVPTRPPTVYTYEARRGEERRTLELYDPLELWRHAQRAGEWVDDDGNRLALVKMALPPPGTFPAPHVSLDAYRTRAEELRRAARPAHAWTTADLCSWVTVFTGARAAVVGAAPRRAFRLKALVRLDLQGRAAGTRAYAFRMNPAAAGQRGAAETWFLALFQVNEAVTPEKAERAILSSFFDAVTVSAVRARPEAGPSSRFQDRAVLGRGRTSPEYERSRQLVKDSIKNLKDWWYVETPNYILLSDLRSRHRAMVRDLQRDIEYLRAAYEQFLPPRKEVTAVSVLRIFGSSDAYQDYVGERYAWTGGLWVPSKQELVIRAGDVGSSREQHTRLLRTTYHEAFHQYIFYAMDRLQTSAWFNEGHAKFFENAELSGRRLVVEEDERLAGGPRGHAGRGAGRRREPVGHGLPGVLCRRRPRP